MMMEALYMNSSKKYDMSLRKDKIPNLKENEVLIKVDYAGICGTDVKMYRGEYIGFSPPIILGHEFSGRVEKIGEKVKELNVGDTVVARPGLSYCRKCRLCLSGKTNLCTEKDKLGHNKNGAFAEYIKVHESQVHLLPKDIHMKEAAMIEPLAVVVHALQSVTIKPTDVVLINGPGTIGLLSLLLCKANGATVAISGLNRDWQKLKLAEELGADLLLDVEKEESETALMNLTKHQGADIVLECSGSAGGVNQGLLWCKRDGKYVQIGTWSHPLTVDFMKIAYKEIDVIGSFGHTIIDWDKSIQMVQQKKIDLKAIIGKIYSLEEWEQAFTKAEKGDYAKVLLKP